jgi:hypothetical protein
MSGVGYQVPQDAGTVPVHVQVIDMEPFALDMIVPTYLAASDLTQRVARDAGLGAFWDDGTRRLFYLRARGRLLGDEEKLEDLGVVPHELLHLLPQPPEGSGVEERPPEYPPNQGYAGAGNLNVAGGSMIILGWTAVWAVALTVEQSVTLGLLPGVGLSLLVTSFARHLWGGVGSAIKIPLTAMTLFVPLLVLAAVPAVVSGASFQTLGLTLAAAFISGLFGIMLGWLAWYGAVEPLPNVTKKQVQEAAAAVTYPCGICGGQVTQDVKVDCRFGCGQVFHDGCYRAKEALASGDGCGVCGFRPANA